MSGLHPRSRPRRWAAGTANQRAAQPGVHGSGIHGSGVYRAVGHLDRPGAEHGIERTTVNGEQRAAVDSIEHTALHGVEHAEPGNQFANAEHCEFADEFARVADTVDKRTHLGVADDLAGRPYSAKCAHHHRHGGSAADPTAARALRAARNLGSCHGGDRWPRWPHCRLQHRGPGRAATPAGAWARLE